MMGRKAHVKKPSYLYRPLDFALDVLRLDSVMHETSSAPTEGEMLLRFENQIRHTLDAARDIVVWEDKERAARGQPPIFGGRDE